MSSRSWSKVKSLFFAASGIDPADRSAFLAQHSDDNTEVRDQVRQLLKNKDEAGSFLSRPATPSGGDADVTESLETAPAQFAPGEIIASRYLVRRFLARGGMGEVYEADDLEMDLTVAIKTLRPSAFGGEALLSRFKREVDLARRVTHPNIGRIFDIGHHTRADGENIPFLTMEFLEGETLAQRIRRGGPIPDAEALPLVREIVQALDAIHQTGIVHRDFKSANVMLIPAANGQLHARVMDFGLARPAALDGSTLTRTGLVSGTPAYMAPEQFENVSTAASDIYALGVVLHEMLLGVRPMSSRPQSHPPHWARFRHGRRFCAVVSPGILLSASRTRVNSCARCL